MRNSELILQRQNVFAKPPVLYEITTKRFLYHRRDTACRVRVDHQT